MHNQQGNHPNGPRQAPANRPPSRPTPNRTQGSAGPRRPANTRPPEDGQRVAKKSSNGSHLFGAFILVVITVVLCILLAIFILRSASDLFGLKQVDHQYEVVIPEGSDIADIAKILHKAGVVDQTVTFRAYAGLKGEKLVLNAGTYNMNSNMSYDQIFSIITTGDIKEQIVNITFIEGMALEEIALQLEKEKVCDSKEFIEYMQTTDFSSYKFYDKLPEEAHRFLKLEGYVFPDTYQFYVNEKVSSVAKKFLGNFDRRISQDILSRMDDIKMTLDETMILASLIQKEAGDPTEMRKVSAVFHNRLDAPNSYPLLQSDVTIFYVNDHIKGKNFANTPAATQELFDAYNTYSTDGLPVGPICNPGFDAIMAALYPAETSDYYFVTDVNGKYYYAATLEGHTQNIALAKSMDESGNNEINGGILTHNEQDASK